jgi:hypothetical protein
MALKGVGHHSIAATLNEDKVPPFKGSMWHRSYVAKTLSNPAVIGTFIPHVEEHRDGKLVRVPQLPMEGYYPAIVKKGDYLRVQSLRKSAASPQRGRHAGTVSNILGGLARCPRCGETMTLANKSGGYRYLVCTKAKAKAGCKYKVVKYWPIEGALSVYPERLTQNVPDMSEAEAEVRGQLKKVCFNLEVNEDALQQLIRVASSGGRRPAALLQKIDDQEQAVAELRAEERALQERLREFSRPALDDKLEALHDALCTSEEMDRLAVNTLFRQLFTLVTVNYMTGQLEFRWQHGGTTHVEYKWFAEGFGAERRSGSRVQSHPQRAVQAL